MVGGLIAGAVLVERALVKAWAEMRKDIHPLAPAGAKLQQTKAVYRKRLDTTTDVREVLRELHRVTRGRGSPADPEGPARGRPTSLVRRVSTESAWAAPPAPHARPTAPRSAAARTARRA